MTKGEQANMTVVPITARLAEALAYAAIVHGADARKGTAIPYVSHLLGVASLVLEHGGDEDQAIAALLHDAAEDHGGEARLAHVDSTFGDDVREIVAACSDSVAVDRDDKQPWWPRKVKYLCHLPEAPPRALLISASDKLHNIRAITADHRQVGDALWDRFSTGCEGTLWYYRSLSLMFARSAVPASLVAEFEATVDRLVGRVSSADTLWASGCRAATEAREKLRLDAVLDEW